MWFQDILMSSSWSSRCPSFDHPLLPCWKAWTWRFWKAFGRGGWGIVVRREFFFHVMVGGDGGVVGSKELVGWVDTVTTRCFLKRFWQRTIRAWPRDPMIRSSFVCSSWTIIVGLVLWPENYRGVWSSSQYIISFDSFIRRFSVCLVNLKGSVRLNLSKSRYWGSPFIVIQRVSVSIPLDLSTRSFIPLHRVVRSWGFHLF